MNKSIYVIQPYPVGTKTRSSLAVIIPAAIVREYNLNTNTPFAVQVDRNTRTIFMQMIDVSSSAKDGTANTHSTLTSGTTANIAKKTMPTGSDLPVLGL